MASGEETGLHPGPGSASTLFLAFGRFSLHSGFPEPRMPHRSGGAGQWARVDLGEGRWFGGFAGAFMIRKGAGVQQAALNSQEIESRMVERQVARLEPGRQGAKYG